jgi:hypothetical protein
MAVRVTCLDLIHRLRRDAGDPYSHLQFFTDDDLQDILDRHRIPWRQWELTAERTLTQGGIYSFTDYFARGEGGSEVGDWEKGYLLQWGDWSTLTPATADENTGHWTFTDPPPGRIPPVFITGYSYDRNGAAVECWESRASAIWAKFDAQTQGASARRSQMYDHCCDRAEHFRMQQRVAVAQLVRTDVISDLPGQFWRPGNAFQ